MVFRGTRYICFALMMMVSPTVSQDERVSLKFDELVEFAVARSVVVQIIEGTYDLTRTERDQELQWTNPGFNYSQEVADVREQYMILSKQIEMPWVYARRHRNWEFQLQAAEYKKQAQIRRLMTELKSGYIEIKLLGTQLAHLNQLRDVIVDASTVAQDQLKEGTLSGVEQHLIQMTLVNINARQQAIRQEEQSVRSQWKVNMGISGSADLQLLTDIHFQTAALNTTDFYLSMVPNTPGYKQGERTKMAIQSRMQMEKGRLIPHFSLFGGSKNVGSGLGYVAGISIPLPVLNRNRAVIQKQQTELKIASRELERYEQNLRGQIQTLVLAIWNLGTSLDMTESHFKRHPDMISGVLAAYQEGWMSLTEMLNAILIHAEGNQKFYKQLTDYYRGLFELEAITGQTLVTFAAQEGDQR